MRAFYKAVADGLHRRLNLRPQDAFINFVAVKKEMVLRQWRGTTRLIVFEQADCDD